MEFLSRSRSELRKVVRKLVSRTADAFSWLLIMVALGFSLDLRDFTTLDALQLFIYLLIERLRITAKALLKKESVNTLVGHWLAKFAVEELTDRNCTNSVLLKQVSKNDFDGRVAVRNGYLDP